MSLPSYGKLPENPRIIFMGTPEFAVPSFTAVYKAGYNILSVITQPDRPKGRGRKIIPSPVKTEALKYNIPVMQPENLNDGEILSIIKEMSPDIFIVAAYGLILRAHVLSIPKFGALNIHASLLPKYRGAAPINWAIFNGEKETGLSAMLLDEGMDSGDVFFTEKIFVDSTETAGQLHDRLMILSGPFILNVLDGLKNGMLTPVPQDKSMVSFAPKITNDMVKIDWNNTASKISGLIRGLDPKPGATAVLNGTELKLFSAILQKEKIDGTKPGFIYGVSPEGVEVETSDGSVLVRELQCHGKKRLTASEFIKGFNIRQGMIFTQL